MEKLEWCRIRGWKNFEDTFIRFDVIHERDGQTLRDSKDRACIASRGKNGAILWNEGHRFQFRKIFCKVELNLDTLNFSYCI